jgi:assimilatory nitrate reductase electron transfer subunit
MRRVVIIGYGMAAAKLAERIRFHGKDIAVTIVGGEHRPAYNRVLLSTVIAGTMSISHTEIHDEKWAIDHEIDVRLGVEATKINRANRRVLLADGDEISYDWLVFATGARTALPPIDGIDGALGLRTAADCERILAQAEPGAPVAVLGGGVLGVELARGLAGRGCLVTIIHSSGHLMPRQLDAPAGRILALQLEKSGITLCLGKRASAYVPGDGVKLDDGTIVPADLVVVTAGVRPNVEVAEAAGLTVDHGIVIDGSLHTNDPRVFALGDCAQFGDEISGLIQPAYEQAEVLAKILTGHDPAARYYGTPVVTKLKASGCDVMSLGSMANGEVVTLQDNSRGKYAALCVRDDRVVGAIIVGFPETAATIT